MVSALTLFGLDDMMARYASYETFAEIIRHRFDHPKKTLEELFSRLVFNILCGNTDDHARNHAAFWNGKTLSLTPAYDICPQGRTGNEASQAMLISGNNNLSKIKSCIAAAQHFQLSKDEAKTICDRQRDAIETNWHTDAMRQISVRLIEICFGNGSFSTLPCLNHRLDWRLKFARFTR
jgi:serine/threonine-protein kinase HipA